MLIPLLVLWAFSSIFEMVEWAAAEVFGGDLGVAYLGIQGDIWDAQKDMFLAHLGAAIAYCDAAVRYALFRWNTFGREARHVESAEAQPRPYL
jgi:uncharacterized membrane protein YjdF